MTSPKTICLSRSESFSVTTWYSSLGLPGIGRSGGEKNVLLQLRLEISVSISAVWRVLKQNDREATLNARRRYNFRKRDPNGYSMCIICHGR